MGKYFILFCIVIIPAVTFAQNSNSLFMVMSANSLLESPEIFREMQLSIEEELGDVNYGFGVEIFREKISKFKLRFKEGLDSLDVKLQLEKNTSLSLILKIPTYYNGKIGTDEITKVLFESKSNFKKQDISLKNSISNFFKNLLNSITSNKKTQKSILYSITKTLTESGILKKSFSESISPEEMIQDISIALLNPIIEMTVNSIIEELIRNDLYDIDSSTIHISKINNSEGSIKDSIENKILEPVNKKLKIHKDETVSKLYSLLDNTEFIITQQISKMGDKFISANIGASVTEGEGNFAGGLNFLFKSGSKIRFGFYINGQLESNKDTTLTQDTTNVPSSLYGFQFRWAPLTWLELNILGAYLISPKYINAGQFGLGVSFRIGNDLILGGSYIFTMGKNSFPINVFGINFTSTSGNTPAILFGFGYENNKAIPIFQISYPIAAK